MLTPLFNRCAYKNSVALALIGAPGHGKTALIEEWCRVNKRPLVKLLASCLDETDVAGVMVPRGERANTLSPNWIDALGENGVLFCDELNCLPGDAEILTDKGFVRFDELEDDAVVAQIDGKQEITFVKPEKVHRIDHDGEMVRFHTKHIDILMTPNHRVAYREFVASPKFLRSFQPTKIMTAEEACHYDKPFYIPCGGRIEGDARLADKMKFQIAFAADGTILYQHRKTDTFIARFALTKERKQKELERLCDSLGLRYSKSKEVDRKPGVWSKYIQYDVMLPNGYATKNLCDVCPITEISYQLAREMLVYLTKWDGTVAVGGGMSFTSTKKHEADYVQVLAALSNCRSRLHSIEHEDNCNTSYTVHISFQRDDYEIMPKSISREQYKGKVYCVTVPTGMFIARYKKSTFVTGNCARREVQDTLLTIIQSRHMPNGEKLPDGVMIVAAMNPAEMCDNYEMSPAMRTRFMWCKYSYGINKFVAWFTGQNVSTISASKYQAPTDHQTFDEWLSLFRESSEFEADKKALLFEAVKLGLDFTPDLDFADKDHATCPRNLANLTYWTRNASEMVQFAPAFIDEKEVNILKSVPMTCYKNVGNSIFKNTRKQTEQGEAENELLEQRKGLFDTIQQEVDQAE